MMRGETLKKCGMAGPLEPKQNKTVIAVIWMKIRKIKETITHQAVSEGARGGEIKKQHYIRHTMMEKEEQWRVLMERLISLIEE
ncbi:hypothetical protein OUZ56_031882 [Daphnia magna]|uniref:Uncharacterized protein n=1 Tax=Daphnia magna TaxID=35525 RepID=A0ABQ9ZVH3_9CRUS|nr:hypothetical protein OUZ56_031882 [Daphnia magna]